MLTRSRRINVRFVMITSPLVRYTKTNTFIILRVQPFVSKNPFVREATTWRRVMGRWNSIELLNSGNAVRLLATSITTRTRDVLPKVINLYEGIRNGDRHSLAKAITLG